MRVLCVWCPNWALGRADAPSDRPCLVVTDRVVAADGRALAAGVSVGMARREAEALCPDAVVLERDVAEEARRFEPVVEAIEGVVPRVEIVEPGLVFVPIDGAVGYYGGEERVVAEIERVTAEAAPRFGVADGPFAARWAATLAHPGTPRIVTDTAAFLAGLDISTLEADELVATFRWLGVTTLGELARLPRGAVASRFGPPGLEAHRVATGEPRRVTPRDIPPELAVEQRFDEPLELIDQVAFAARALAARLMALLRREGIAPHRVAIDMETADGSHRHRVWRSADPMDERTLADRVWWQLRAWIEGGGGPGAGIVRLRLDPADLSGEGRQLSLWEDVAARLEAERALARTQTLVGPDRVLTADPQGGRMPGERVAWRRWGEDPIPPARDPAAPWPGATPAPSPALVPPQPPRLEVEWEDGIPVRVRLGTRWEPVLGWSGPWRLLGRWWRGEGPADRYQIVTSVGAFLCVVQEGGAFLAGIYD